MRRCVLFLSMIVSVTLLGQVKSASKFDDTHATPEERAAGLVWQMTLEEKVGQMQNSAPAIPRLGVPAYDWWNEALHGVARAGLATVFPQAIGLAATWDTELERRIADTISTEARAKYNDFSRRDIRTRYHGLTFWSPNINIFRDPRWGRGQETYGEDPYLTSEMALAFIRGMQGNDPHYLKTVATSKHFAVHSGPEASRHQFNTDVSQKDLDETYLFAFRRTVLEGKVMSFMCAYNSIDGAPACANNMLLKQHLRETWHFGGYVVSDCGAVGDIYQGHHFARSMAEAAAKAVKSGTDLDCGNEYKTLVDAVHQGYISEAEINEAVTRLFVARIRLGLFDSADRVPFSNIGLDQLASAAHQKLALEAAEKSMVLLKNENRILPLENAPKRIAVVGPAADDPDAMLGNYNGIPRRIVTPLMGIQEKFGTKAVVQFAPGSVYAQSSAALVPQTALRTNDGQQGWTAEYFNNEDLNGAPALRRVEPRGYFYWDMQDPAVMKAAPSPVFSVRWSGKLKPEHSGDYQLGIRRQECDNCPGTNSIRLFFQNQLLVETRGRAAVGNQNKTKTVQLEAGKEYPIRLEYLQQGGGSGVELVWVPPAADLLKDAVEKVRDADIAIAVIGLNSRLEGEESPIEIPGFSHGDRTDLNLPEPQEQLLKAVLDTGKPVIVVLINGSALAVNMANERAAAILEAWYPGQDGGTAIANTLSGENNPAGRLPVTFYSSVTDLPPFTDYSMKGRTYRYFKGKPLYPFGYGLSYSTFEYSRAGRRELAGEKAEVSAEVRNTSSKDGDEVAQLYVTNKDGDVSLRGFQRIHVRAGESKRVSFVIDASTAVQRISIQGQYRPDAS